MVEPLDPKALKAQYFDFTPEFFAPLIDVVHKFPPTDPKDSKSGWVTLSYEKVQWDVNGTIRGLRYGDNPGQQAAMYRLVDGFLRLGDVETIGHGMGLVTNAELMRHAGKHPGKTNLTDPDNALAILRYLTERPATVIVKHNNPCGVAFGDSLLESYLKADKADRIAAFGGTIALNRSVDRITAEAIKERYAEVVVAPEYEEGSLEILAARKNLRVLRIKNIAHLQEWGRTVPLNYKGLIDGGFVIETGFIPEATTIDDFAKLPLAFATYKGVEYKIRRAPTQQELRDLRFTWIVECYTGSNSVAFGKDEVAFAIVAGGQDRVGSVKVGRAKAVEKLADLICFERYGMPYDGLVLNIEREGDLETRDKLEAQKLAIDIEVVGVNGGLKGAVMASEAFFPFRDGVDAALRAGVTAIVQPGGSDRDFESIEACNEKDAAMIFSRQRSFKH